MSGGPGFAVDTWQWVRLGGRLQFIRVLAAREGLPVLLVLHGGPGFPNGRDFLRRHAALARHFTILAWDQRGAGLSALTAGSARLTLDGLVEDAAELVSAARRRVPGAPLFVLGLSWGSELGIALVRTHPEGIAAYVGSGQAVAGVAGEQLSYRAAVAGADAAARDRRRDPRARRRARRDLAILRLVGPPRGSRYRPLLLGLAVQRRLLARYTGTAGPRDAEMGARTADIPAPIAPAPVSAAPASAEPASSTPVPRPVSLLERAATRVGIVRSLAQLWPTATGYDFRTEAARLAVPVHFLQGRHDRTTPSALVAEYAAVLGAPAVDLVWFEHSGHSPARNEPERFERVLIEQLLRTPQSEPQPREPQQPAPPEAGR
ncbi:MAG: alpha/beta hydrolase [Pseudoclavibacter sp.]